MQTKTLTREQAGVDNAPGYLVNEVFYSVQGEGILAGEAMTFVRFAKCNLRCSVANAGFDCDTEFEAGRRMDGDGILDEIDRVRALVGAPAKVGSWVLLTGGEPGLQVDTALVDLLHEDGYRIAVETNGTVKLPNDLDWVCVSPKSAWHTIRQRRIHELKLVRMDGQALPDVRDLPKADNYLVSPAFLPSGGLDPASASWCVEAVKADPRWRLSLQSHKLLGVR